MAKVKLFKPMDIPYEHFEVNGVPMSLLTGVYPEILGFYSVFSVLFSYFLAHSLRTNYSAYSNSLVTIIWPCFLHL